MLDCLIVGIGGMAGTIMRYLIGLIPYKMESGFPVKTLLINVTGAFLISTITVLAARNKALDPRVTLMLKVGVCGGFTTFSTLAYESADLLQSGHTMTALAYLLSSGMLGILAVFAAQVIF